MYGYKMKIPQSMPEVLWGFKASVDRYDWVNKNKADMVEFAICKAASRTVLTKDSAPTLVSGKSFSCIVGEDEVKSFAENGVDVEIVSVAVRLRGMESVTKELETADFKAKDALLLPRMLTDLTMQDWIKIENLLYRIASEHVKKEAASGMLCAAMTLELMAILDELARKNLKVKRQKQVNYYALKADSILSRGYAQHITLQSVSAELGITPNYLSAIYKSCTGIGFSDRLCALRMQAAEKMLLAGNVSAADVAQAVGYEDESHFRRRFKQYFGVGIREYCCVNREQTLYHAKPQRRSE